MTDAKNLLALGCACRRASAAFAVEACRLSVEVERGEQPDTGAAAETVQHALDLEHAAQQLQADAQDTELLAVRAHLRAGGQVLIVPLPVIVGQDQDTGRPANDGPRSMRAVRALVRAFRRKVA